MFNITYKANMGTVSSRAQQPVDASTNSSTVRRDPSPQAAISLSAPRRAASSSGLFSGLFSWLIASPKPFGWENMPAEVVDNVASFLPLSDTLSLAAINTCTRNALQTRTLSAALAKQVADPKSVRDLDLFMALFEQISTLPFHLQGQHLAALAKGMSIHKGSKSESDWEGARRVLLQACDRLPPEFRAATLIALASIITYSDFEESRKISFEYVLDLIADLPPPSKAAALCALIDAECSSPVHNSTVFWGVISASKDLPKQLHGPVLQRLIAGYGSCFFTESELPLESN